MLDAAFDVQFGGYYVGDTGWNVQIRSPRPYFKIYHQRLGELELSFANGQTYHLAADRVALLSAFDLRAQRASSVMEHCWMHFLPASPRLTHRICSISPFFDWPDSEFPEILELDSLFRRGVFVDTVDERQRSASQTESFRHSTQSFLSALANPSQAMRLHALVLHVLARALETAPTPEDSATLDSIRRLAPVLDFIDGRYTENPSLEEMANCAHLAPNYFHRLFRQAMGMTPYRYLLSRRMTLARLLLLATDLEIKEIAGRCGYQDEFHFSRTFRKHFGRPPTQVRREEARP